MQKKKIRGVSTINYIYKRNTESIFIQTHNSDKFLF